MDARGGRVAVEGWEKPTPTAVEDAITDLGSRGIRRFVYTPVEVDGTLEGPGIDGLGSILDACATVGSELIYSGGVGTLDDLGRLGAFAAAPLSGVIVGRALYERRFTVAEALEALAGNERMN